MFPNLNNLPVYDTTGVNERIARFCSRSIKKSAKVEGLKLALSMVDLTTLEGKDTKGKVQQLCYKAMHPHDILKNIPTVAAICVYPSYVRVAKNALQGSDIHVASVATAFPSGQSKLQVKLDDTKFAVEEGADEIDMVISRGEFLSGNYQYVFDEIAAVKEACGKAHLKVILETGELDTLNNVRKASEIAMYAGADFIKTSTGKIQPAATMPVTYVMLDAIKEFYLKTGKMIGMKPAGGISTSKIALQYLVMLNEVLGNQWMNKKYFRFGASSVLNDILMQLVKAETGLYQSPNYFSKD
ncbi:MAG: deoxyribose-phosphate aldolase [Lutibacter sp.]|nr:MAG: deoxyribose-phosphate aldolase [Lutibacter sp.]